MKVKTLLFLLLLIIFTSCNQNSVVENSLNLVWEISESGRTLYPDTLPVVSKYEIQVLKDGSLVRSITDITETFCIISNLNTGTYNIIVTGISENGLKILQGTTDAEVLDYEINNSTLTLKYFFDEADSGSISVNSNWLASGYLIDTAKITILDSDGLDVSPGEITVIDNISFNASISDLPPGIYSMKLEYFRGEEVINIPMLFSVVVFPGIETICDFALDQTDFNPYWSINYAGFRSITEYGDGYKAIDASLLDPEQTCFDLLGNYYIADKLHHVIRKVSPEGIITTVAGSWVEGYSGDGGGATMAMLAEPEGVAVDSLGNIYIADTGNKRVRKVDTEGKIWTIAGTGEYSSSGETTNGMFAITAQLYTPIRLTLKGDDILYIVDKEDHRIRELDLNTGIINTFIGTGISGNYINGAVATATPISYPTGIAFWGDDVYITCNNYGLAKIDSTGILTILHTTLRPYNSLTIDAEGKLYIPQRTTVLLIGTDGGASIIAGNSGNSIAGYYGNGLLATEANFFDVKHVSIASDNSIYLSDSSNGLIRRIDSNGIINNVIGTYGAYIGYGRPAVDAKLLSVKDVAEDSLGNKYLADIVNDQIQKIDSSGIISLFAGSGVTGRSGDGGLAINAMFNDPTSIAIDSNDNLYIVDSNNNVIRKIDTSGIITTIAGVGTQGYYGDGIAATEAIFNYPKGIFCDSADNLYISDTGNNVIRKIDSSGIITTVVGFGELGYFGDGGLATDSKLNAPRNVFVDTDFNIYIADTGNNVVRYVDHATGKISTIAGTGSPGKTNGGVSAVTSMLNQPYDVALDKYGQLFIAEFNNDRILRVSSNGIINTINSYGYYPFISDPVFVFIDREGVLYAGSESIALKYVYSFEYYNDKF